MDQLFSKSLIDVVKASRSIPSYDLLTYMTQLTQDVKQELQNSNENVRRQALLKLFFISMEGQSIKWAEFNVINSMGSPDYLIKRYAFSTAHLVIDSQSQGLIMVTNLFKKELSKSQNIIDCSVALSCVGNICNRDLGEAIIQQIINLYSHSKPLIRKKALAVLAKIFAISPHLIPNNLEKVFQKLEKEETNTGVLSCAVSLVNQVLNITPALYPLFMKFVYDNLQKQKSNWLLIKLVKISNKLMSLEPRFQKKLIEPFTKLLNQTSSKSLQFELAYSIMKYFKDQKNLFDSGSEILKQFLHHSDPNLRSLGLECLTQMLETDNKTFTDFLEQLKFSYQKGDYFYKQQIINILKQYTASKHYSNVVNFLLYDAIEKEHDKSVRCKLIECALFISQKDKFSNIDDPEQLFLYHMPRIAQRINDQENAYQFRGIIFDLLARIPELNHYSERFCNSMLTIFEDQGVELSRNCTTFQVVTNFAIRNESDSKETLLKTMLLVASESAKVMNLQQILKQLILLMKTKNICKHFNCIPEFYNLLFKLLVNSVDKLEDNNTLQTIIDDKELNLPPIQNQDNRKVVLAWIFKQIIEFTKSICRYDNIHALNFYLKLICNELFSLNNELFLNIMTERTEQYELNIESIIQLLDDIETIIQNLKAFGRTFKEDLPPIHQDAQKLIKLPEGLDLNVPFDIDMSEVQFIKQLNDNHNDDQKEKIDSIPAHAQSPTLIQEAQTIGHQQHELNMEQNQSVGEQKKREIKINRDDYLPPGVTKDDLQKLEEDD